MKPSGISRGILGDEHPLIKAALEELVSLRREQAGINKEHAEIALKKAQIDQKIETVGHALQILQKVYEQPKAEHTFEELFPDPPDLGVTDQVRRVLRIHHPAYLTPTAVRDELEMRGTSLKQKGYDNPMALIHQILRRLEAQDEVMSTSTDSGKAYKSKLKARLPNTTYLTDPDPVPEAGYGPKKRDEK